MDVPENGQDRGKDTRTLEAVTKVDLAPEGHLEKLTANNVVVQRYVCVRNHRPQSYEDEEEASCKL